MKKEEKPVIESIHVIIGPNGKIWKETARLTYDQCRNDFVKEWLSRVKDHLSSHTCWQVWGAFEKEGFKVETIEMNHLNGGS